MSLLSEFRRRKVFRVAVVYAATAFAVLQGADVLLPNLGLPDWTMRFLTVLLVLGFPIALVLAWALELKPDGGIQPTKAAATTPGEMPALLGKRTLIVAGLLVAVGIGLSAGWFLKPDGPPVAVESTDTAVVLNARQSVAVLPFDNLSDDPEQGYFADGLTEEILNALAALPKLLVTARTSSFFYKGQDVPVDEIGERLGVEHILEGSVRRSGQQVRVTAQLVRARDGFHVWSETYDRPVDDGFVVQTDIATQVASALGILLDEEERALMRAAGVNNPEAYAFYAKGEELFRLAHGSLPQIETLVRANHEYDRAIVAAPGLWAASYNSADLYAHVLLQLAAGASLADMPEGVGDDPAAALKLRLDAAMRHAPTQVARQSIDMTRRVFSEDWTMVADLARRIYSDPEPCGIDQWAHAVSVPFGAAKQAVEYYTRSVECNRLDGGDWTMASMAELYAGDPGRSLSIIEDGRDVYVATLREEVMRLRALMANGRTAEARAGLSRLSGSDNLRISMEGELAAARGDREGALTARDRLLGESARDPDVFDAALRLSAQAGDREMANQIAAAIDGRPGGPMLLVGAIYFCRCGALFDLEETPILAKRLEEAGISWPPAAPVEWPLKDW